MSFADLKRNSAQDTISKLNEEASKFKSGGFAKDERYWQPELDGNGEGGAVIRFLPAPDGEDVPFARKFSYGFKGPTGKWFIENSPATIGLPCPIMEHNSKLWDSGDEGKRDLARKRKRRLSFITNIYVVRHKGRPSDEGKVFLYEFGKKIWDKLQDKMNPDDEDKKPMNPFCLWTGANFRLKIGQVSGFRNYDKSEFDETGPLSPDDAELERIWRQAHSIKGEIAPEKFKSYIDLERKLNEVLGGSAQQVLAAQDEDDNTGASSGDWAPRQTGGEGDKDLDWLKELAGDQK